MRKSWRVSFPALHAGQCGNVVKGFKKRDGEDGLRLRRRLLLQRPTGRGVLAYRKVNGMARTERAGAAWSRTPSPAAAATASATPSAGEHAEVPLSKQVLVLAKGDKPFAIYPVSTGKPSTPTVTGHYTFYRQRTGLQLRGHVLLLLLAQRLRRPRLRRVPNYAASHGCVRTFIADQPRIYDRINYGESIFVF